MACGVRDREDKLLSSRFNDAGTPAGARGQGSLKGREAAGDSCQGMEIRQPGEGRAEVRDKEGLTDTIRVLQSA